MKTPLERIRLGAIVLAVISFLAVVAYRFIGGYRWLDAVWMVVITISSVGYAEQSSKSTTVQILTLAVILLGMSAAMYTFSGFIQLALEGEVERALGLRRMTRGIENLNDHVIVCGFGRVGENLVRDLQAENRPLVVIDDDPTQIEHAQEAGSWCILGDATDEAILERARIRQAAFLFTGLPTDAANVFITLTARDLNSQLQIIARAQHKSTSKKLYQAGADRVIMPTVISAHHVARIITRPTTADLMELVSETGVDDIELDEFRVKPEGRLHGITIETTRAHKEFGLLVVAIRKQDGSLVFNPEAAYSIQSTDTLIAMGHKRDIDRFRKSFDI